MPSGANADYSGTSASLMISVLLPSSGTAIVLAFATTSGRARSPVQAMPRRCWSDDTRTRMRMPLPVNLNRHRTLEPGWARDVSVRTISSAPVCTSARAAAFVVEQLATS